MPWLKWLPWRFILRRVARAHGFLDPVAVMARVQQLAQPSEVEQPIELLRAGVVFHARGLINSRVVQHNLDWVWPYWIERQFDPHDPSFVPRAFSATHINLTHRNWTAVGLPDIDALPIVDPRGLLTPRFDGWSLEGWVIGEDGERLLPSKALQCEQSLNMTDGLALSTAVKAETMSLTSKAWVDVDGSDSVCRLQLDAWSDKGGWLVLALRPYNPEGISFIHRVALNAERDGWIIDDRDAVHFDDNADRHHVSDYRHGDVAIHLDDLEDETEGVCDVGLVTAAAMFRIEPGASREVTLHAPLDHTASTSNIPGSWTAVLDGCCRLQVPDEQIQFLIDAALRTLVLHAPLDVYPGPFTYKRFWFRDAAFIINALLAVGLHDRAERAIDRFPDRQRNDGYFHSQDGEWDSNGAVLWLMERFQALTGRPIKQAWRKPILDGARWIARKRHNDDLDAAHAGLLPAGFSAEHLGPNDFYYWDDFFGLAGLRAAASLADGWGDEAARHELDAAADAFAAAIDRSLDNVKERLGRPALPASPYRRLDAGAIGSLVAGYPLQLYASDDPRLLSTIEFLMQNCMIKGGFFQDMIHSGINPYLTPAYGGGDASKRRSPRDPPHRCCGQCSITDGPMAGGNPSAHRRRLHGRWPACLGGGGMGDDDAPLFRSRGERRAHSLPRHCAALACYRNTN